MSIPVCDIIKLSEILLRNQLMNRPFFYDITLRDGNQALKKPCQLSDKKVVFEKLLDLKVQAVEVGFPP